MFWTVPLSIITSFSLYTQQWYMSYRLQLQLASRIRTELLVPSWSCSQAVSKPVWHIPLLCVQWKTPDDEQRNCPKHVEFYSKNKFEKLVHQVGFIVREYSFQFFKTVIPVCVIWRIIPNSQNVVKLRVNTVQQQMFDTRGPVIRKTNGS